MQQQPKTLIERLWEKVNAHCDLAVEAEDNDWPIAYQYHKRRAQEYLDLINALADQHEQHG